jgi:hypothetical protein
MKEHTLSTCHGVHMNPMLTTSREIEGIVVDVMPSVGLA